MSTVKPRKTKPRKTQPRKVDAPTSDTKLEEINNASKRHSKRLEHSIVYKPPYCMGTMLRCKDDFKLFYSISGSRDARSINLADATPEELQELADACEPATFGMNQEDVYDETYRKAGKMDASDFALKFDPTRLGLIDSIRTEMLEEGRELRKTKPELARDVNAELYKLNVYGEGAFFKPHVDTPRSELMFGSLVIIFPTPHEGGELVLRDTDRDGETRTASFDTPSLIAAGPNPSFFYVAFFSDVEHEVLPVTSGYRVTVTYNLYYAKGVPPASEVERAVALSTISETQTKLTKAMRNAFADPLLLPEGGSIVFHLHHQYPLPVPPSRRTSSARFGFSGLDQEDPSAVAAAAAEARAALKNLEWCLKGTDAAIWRTMCALGLEPELKVVYFDTAYPNPRTAMLDRYVPLEDVVNDELLSDYLVNEEQGTALRWAVPHEFQYQNSSSIRTLFINHSSWNGRMKETRFMAYGNQAMLRTAYWRVGVFVGVVPFEERAAQATPPVED